MAKQERMYKLILLGDPSVGKTSIRKRYMGAGFSKNYLPTMGADFAVKKVSNGKNVELQIWDIAGQKGFEVLIPRFMKNANGVFFIYDLSRKETFENLSNWVKQFKKTNPEKYSKVPFVIIGNKNDLDNIEVEDTEVENYINYLVNQLNLDSDKIKFIRTSAKTGENIDEAFDEITQMLQ